MIGRDFLKAQGDPVLLSQSLVRRGCACHQFGTAKREYYFPLIAQRLKAVGRYQRLESLRIKIKYAAPEGIVFNMPVFGSNVIIKEKLSAKRYLV